MGNKFERAKIATVEAARTAAIGARDVAKNPDAVLTGIAAAIAVFHAEDPNPNRRAPRTRRVIRTVAALIAGSTIHHIESKMPPLHQAHTRR